MSGYKEEQKVYKAGGLASMVAMRQTRNWRKAHAGMFDCVMLYGLEFFEVVTPCELVLTVIAFQLRERADKIRMDV